MKITKQACVGTFTSSLGELPFELTGGLLSIKFESYEKAMAWLTWAEARGTLPEQPSLPLGAPIKVDVSAAVSARVDTEGAVLILSETPVATPVSAPIKTPVLLSVATETPAPLPATAPETPAEPETSDGDAPDTTTTSPAGEPQKRKGGRPKGSKNKPKTPDTAAATPPPAVESTAPAATSEPEPVPPPVSVPQPPAPNPATATAPATTPATSNAVIKKATVMVGTVGWPVEISVTNMGFKAVCTSIPSLTAGSGDDEKEALADIRQILANYMRENLSSPVAVKADDPLVYTKGEAAAAAPVMSEASDLPKSVLTATGPSVAVYEYVYAQLKQDIDLDVPSIHARLTNDWKRIPVLREKPVMAPEKLTSMVEGYRNRALTQIQAEKIAEEI